MDEPARLSDRRGRRPAPAGAPAAGGAAPVRPPAPAPVTQPIPLTGFGRPTPDLTLWHVTVTFAGRPLAVADVDAALRRLVDVHPFLASIRYAADRAEVSYWDEAEDVDDAAALGLRLWAEHRRAADLPEWKPVGVEVVDRATFAARGERMPAPVGLGEVRPW